MTEEKVEIEKVNYVGKLFNTAIIIDKAKVINIINYSLINFHLSKGKLKEYTFVKCEESNDYDNIIEQYDLNKLKSFFITHKSYNLGNAHLYGKYYVGIKAINLDHAVRFFLNSDFNYYHFGNCSVNDILVQEVKPEKFKPIELIKDPYERYMGAMIDNNVNNISDLNKYIIKY